MLVVGHLHDDVMWLQLPESFASILSIYWQSILVIVDT